MNRDPYRTRVVITGMGTINPLGNNVKEFWENLEAGKSGIRLAQHTPLDNYYIKIGAEVDFPDLSEYFPKKYFLKRLDRFIIFGHVAAAQAFKDSGLETERSPRRFGALIGTGDAGVGIQVENIKNVFDHGMDSVSPYYVVGCIPNTASGYFAKEFNLQGPNFSVNSACATSNHAIGLASMMIKMGMADAMFAGGSEAVVNIMGFAGFGVIGALSQRNDSPQTASRPFDKDRDGFILGEGAGVICLEELEHAKKRGAHIYGELKGFGFSCDAHDLVAPHPEGRGACSAMELALENASLNKEQIDLINAHGTSTPLGDLSESRAICRVFKDNFKDIKVHSTKSMIGHLVGAAGGVEAVAAIMALKKDIIHPTINQFEQDPEILINVVKNKPVQAKVHHILSNSFGFGGQNASIIISRFKD
ncbi:MAG: beta-ketoacyl-ACP synthase II [Spirochaetes bacterium]|nr:beta-ketoacyl-ACP synthase II [Spirochaetota bacterium]